MHEGILDWLERSTQRPAAELAEEAKTGDEMREFKDPSTGCRVRQLTEFDGGAHRWYFRIPCSLEDGRVVVRGKSGGDKGLWLVDMETGSAELAVKDVDPYLNLQPNTGRCWFLRDRVICVADFSKGTEEELCPVPEGYDLGDISITCDGRAAFLKKANPPSGEPSTAEDVGRRMMENHAISTGGSIHTLDLQTGEVRQIHQFHTAVPGHLDCSPTDPSLLRFCHEGPWHVLQRVWLLASDGTCHPIRPQERNEAVGHEFWWPGGKAIGYKYLDRRNEPGPDEHPLSEYCGSPVHVGIASLDGKEQWLSDRLERYQSHIIVSPDERWFCGEGTHDWFVITIARYHPDSTRLDFKPVATTHAPYTPAGGADINASFSADSRWVIYSDEIEGSKQVYAVEVPED